MSDILLRAIARDAGIQISAAVTTGLVERARQIHNTTPVATAALGRTLTATAIMGSQLKVEDGSVTVQVTGEGSDITSQDVVSTIIKGEATTTIYSYKAASDINKDGSVTLADLAIALVNYQTAEASCDVNLDGEVNTLDYVIIASYAK